MSGLVGFTSAFVVVLQGLAAVGASPDEAASGLLAVTIAMGVASIVMAVATRLPITVAWSTPGAALLVGTGVVDGGWPAAVGAFLVTGVLVALTGLVPWLGRAIAAIPTSIAQAMLAGVLLQLCLGVVTGLAANPLAVAPVVVVWIAASRLAPRFAAPLAFATAAIVIAIHLGATGVAPAASELTPHVAITTPTFTVAGIVGIALPLFLVTMASQNVPGVAVMRGLGYTVPWRPTMVVTGAGTMLAAPLGGHAINLAAISAALAAGPDAGEDRSRRWLASVSSGTLLVVLGIGSSALATLVGLAPVGVVAAVAGLALLGTLASSLHAALDDAADRIPAVAAFAVAASGIAIAGVSAAFWALVVGILLRAVLRGWRRAG